jgi:hypothetical protein
MNGHGARGAQGSNDAGDAAMARLGGYAAIASAIPALVYAVGFVFLNDARVFSPALLAGGLLSAITLAAVYERVRRGASDPALLGLLLGFAGAVGAIAHGGYDLANVLHAPTVVDPGLPFPVDPRGLLTVGLSGLCVLVLSWSALPGSTVPRNLAWLGALLGALLIVVYLGRLIVLVANSLLILVPAGVAAIVVSPAWFAWIGRELLRRSS